MKFMHHNPFPDYLSDLGLNIGLPVIILVIIGIFLVFLAVYHLMSRKIIRASVYFTGGASLLLTGILILTIALNIHTYDRLTYEHEIAIISFKKLANRHFQARIDYTEDKNSVDYLLDGDEWQLDARILRWKPFTQILGLNAIYRLERISGRFQDVEMERTLPRTVYAFNQPQGLDIWAIIRIYHDHLDWVDAYYGSAAYLPMADGASYRISVNQYGILARPENVTARKQLINW